MTYAPPPVYELPDVGQHIAVLADEVDMGWEENKIEPSKGPKHMNKLVFLTDQVGKNGRLIPVTKKLNLTRHRTGDLIKYITAFNHPAPITPATSWDTATYIGCCVGVLISHNAAGTWANIDSVFPLPKNAQRLSIPIGYTRKGGTAQGTASAYHVTSSTTVPTAPTAQPQPAQSTTQPERPARAMGEPSETSQKGEVQPALPF